MPRVMPFYAVKCNPEPSMVAMLAALGAGFDCASIQELQLATAHGVTQDRVIFANPCKRPADFRCAEPARAAGHVVFCLRMSLGAHSWLAVRTFRRAMHVTPSPNSINSCVVFASLVVQVRC